MKTGSCHCGAIKVRVVDGFAEDARAGICHCKQCQTLAGSRASYTSSTRSPLIAHRV